MGSNNKRLGDDRRGTDCGPPQGWRERRRSVERRHPEVQEISFSEWISSMRNFNLRSQSST